MMQIVNGTSYNEKTTKGVIATLEEARQSRKRVRLFYGDPETGIIWPEELDVSGKVGRSGGKVKVPLLIPTERSIGGPAILDQNILKILIDGKEAYRHPNCSEGLYTMREERSSVCGELICVHVYCNGEKQAVFPTHKKANRYIDFMTGKRMTR